MEWGRGWLGMLGLGLRREVTTLGVQVEWTNLIGGFIPSAGVAIVLCCVLERLFEPFW